jgi:plastocyanin
MRRRTPSYAVICVATLAIAAAHGPTEPRATGAVSGRVSLAERGNRSANDVGRSVVWLEAAGARPVPPKQLSVLTEGKEFRPRVSVVPAGSTVIFPNNDPFNHNVFSVSQEGQFDLGLYGRGQSKNTRFNRPGIIRVYCNVHASMAAFIVVRDNPWFTQPSADGSFSIPAVPPGRYALHVWHERTPELVREITVDAQGVDTLQLQLDARGYRFVEHLNKFGQPYSKGGARY